MLMLMELNDLNRAEMLPNDPMWSSLTNREIRGQSRSYRHFQSFLTPRWLPCPWSIFRWILQWIKINSSIALLSILFKLCLHISHISYIYFLFLKVWSSQVSCSDPALQLPRDKLTFNCLSLELSHETHWPPAPPRSPVTFKRRTSQTFKSDDFQLLGSQG